jgi:hypothetical protein
MYFRLQAVGQRLLAEHSLEFVGGIAGGIRDALGVSFEEAIDLTGDRWGSLYLMNSRAASAAP